MKTSIRKSLQLLFISILFCANVFSSDVAFQASVKTDENEALPRVYVRIYIPGASHPMDSMFTDAQGFLERVLHFGNQVYISTS